MKPSRPPAVLLLLMSLALAACATPIGPTPAPVAMPVVEEPTGEPSVPPASPAASASAEVTTVQPGEAWIAFQGTGLELIRPDGTGRHRLYPMLTGGEHLHPDWSPDGERIVFSIRAATDEIWIGNVDGTGAERLIPCSDPCRWVDEPAWSPDGREIAFHRMVAADDGTGTSTLEILDLETGDIRVVATAAEGRTFYAPRWSPDGSRFVAEYVHRSSTSVDAEVISDAQTVIDVNNGDLTEITEAEDRCNNTDWGWTNDRILCSKPISETSFDGPSYLLSLAPDGSDPVPLTPTDGGRSAIHATWLPDGSGAIFIDGGGTMAVAAADGSGLTSATGERRISAFHPRVRPTATTTP